MQSIPLDAAKTWGILAPCCRFPQSISYICPHCGAKCTFTLSHPVNDLARRAISCTSICPSCSKEVYFWTIREASNPAQGKDKPVAIYMYPAIENHYPVPQFPSNVPDALKRSFASAVDAFNSKNYVATAVCSRRTLEGIFKFLVPEDERNAPLAKLIERTTANTDFALPLKSLSHAIRDGGNLGAHFDMESEPDEVLAKQMVELVEYLISYLYVLPNEIAELERSLGKSKA